MWEYTGRDPIHYWFNFTKANPIKKEEIMAATRLTRWLIESHHQQLLFQQPNEAHLKGLLLHIMAH
ncbi:hypothetical protein ACT691_11325 [Vibrio metschnikovii]